MHPGKRVLILKIFNNMILGSKAFDPSIIIFFKYKKRDCKKHDFGN